MAMHCPIEWCEVKRKEAEEAGELVAAKNYEKLAELWKRKAEQFNSNEVR